MPALQRATIENEVFARIDSWLETAKAFGDRDDFSIRQLWRDAEKLSQADAYAASVGRALISHFSGDLQEAQHWLRNAQKWPGRSGSERAELVILSNLGYFSRAGKLLDESPELVGSGKTFVSMALVTAAFEALKKWGEELNPETMEPFVNQIQLAEKCAAALGRGALSESHVRKILDLAGEELRSRRLFFVGAAPVLRTLHDGILFQLPVAVEPAVAAEMTDRVLDGMVDHDLDDPAFSFSFIPAL